MSIFTVIVMDKGRIASVINYTDGDEAARDYIGARHHEQLDAHLFMAEEPEAPAVRLLRSYEITSAALATAADSAATPVTGETEQDGERAVSLAAQHPALVSPE